MRTGRPTRILARLAPAIVLALLAAPAGAAAPHPQRPPAAAAKPVPSQVTLAQPPGAGVAVSLAPVGLSIEYPVMAQDLGTGPCPPEALAAELRRLGSPPIELGGVSQDQTAPAGAAGAPTSWESATVYQLPGSFWNQLQCLLSGARDPLTAGLNMRTGNLSWATQMAAGAQAAAGGSLSFSLGNEPDLYRLPNYAQLDKPFAGEEAAAAGLYLQLASYLKPAVGSIPVVGPELARPAVWRLRLPGVIRQLGAQTVGVHLYPLTDCAGPHAVTLHGLLSGRAGAAPGRLAWVVADAAAAGLPAIISEANSVSCGGLPGVSDSPASAVWGVRFVLSALKTGFREVRFHFSGNSYDPFLVRSGAVLARPLEAALVALNQWLPVGSTVRSVSGVKELLATAVTQPGGGLVLVLDNERTVSRPVVLRSAAGVNVAVFSAARTGPQTAALSPVHGRIRLSVPPNSVVAVTSAAPAPAPAPPAPSAAPGTAAPATTAP